MFYTYILQNTKGQFYIGQTSNIENRLKRHNSGRSKFTKGRGPWQLLHYEEYNTRKEAVKRERELKSWKSAARLRELCADGQFRP